MAYLNIYTGAALATYEKIQAGNNENYINKVYKSTTAKCLYFVNNKGYLHILQAAKTTMNNKTIGYKLTDSILTKNNTIQYKKDFTRDFKTVEELQAFILELIA